MTHRRILSKSSLKSSSSSSKHLKLTEEVSKLYDEIELLRQNVETLKLSIEIRDAAVGTLAREKEKLYVELKSAQKTNRNLHQQLVDERVIHSKEKEYLIEEIRKMTKKECKNCAQQVFKNEEEEIIKLQKQIKQKDEVICNICAKYLKIKAKKKSLWKRLTKLQSESQKQPHPI